MIKIKTINSLCFVLKKNKNINFLQFIILNTLYILTSVSKLLQNQIKNDFLLKLFNFNLYFKMLMRLVLKFIIIIINFKTII